MTFTEYRLVAWSDKTRKNKNSKPWYCVHSNHFNSEFRIADARESALTRDWEFFYKISVAVHNVNLTQLWNVLLSNTSDTPQKIPVGDLYSFINDFPALLWRIEILKSRIEFFNQNHNVAPGIDGTLFLKNMGYRNDRLLPEDQHLVETFMSMVKEGKTAATVFRVRNRDDGVSWLKLTGAVNRRDPAYYYGFLLNVDDTVSVIKGYLDVDLELELMVEDADNPVFIFDYNHLDLVTANPSARKTFGIEEAEFTKLFLNDFYRHSTRQAFEEIIKTLPLSRKWSGKLKFQSTDKRIMVNAETIIRYMVHKGRRLLRVSLQNPETKKALKSEETGANTRDMAELEKNLSGLADIDEIMETCLESPLVSGRCEGIVFSDVHVRKNLVAVYSAGQPFAGMKRAETFSYNGTIAEDINRYTLDYLVVDDTQDSIKPIDWALFVPRGIRSYFAMPFYSRTVLRTVLILCSTAPGRFSGKDPEEFTGMLETMNTAIRSWRRHLSS
ncbi:MAG: hypothetical protein JKP90_01915 [Desulfofustis sp. PB-SRB1]|nr:hypothetical protein [Desulfofustis sp. PB-SRB1]